MLQSTVDKIRALNRKIKNLGVTAVASAAGLNKSTVSRYVNGEREYSLQNFEKIVVAVNKLENKALAGRTSTRLATQRVVMGEDWQIAYFDFVDSFLATKSTLLISQRPADGLDIKLLALISSIVMQLCDENEVEPPEWAKLKIELVEPWFVSKFKSLRAMCLVDCPLYFKRNNIFVGADFLRRA